MGAFNKIKLPSRDRNPRIHREEEAPALLWLDPPPIYTGSLNFPTLNIHRNFNKRAEPPLRNEFIVFAWVSSLRLGSKLVFSRAESSGLCGNSNVSIRQERGKFLGRKNGAATWKVLEGWNWSSKSRGSKKSWNRIEKVWIKWQIRFAQVDETYRALLPLIRSFPHFSILSYPFFALPFNFHEDLSPKENSWRQKRTENILETLAHFFLPVSSKRTLKESQGKHREKVSGLCPGCYRFDKQVPTLRDTWSSTHRMISSVPLFPFLFDPLTLRCPCTTLFLVSHFYFHSIRSIYSRIQLPTAFLLLWPWKMKKALKD